MKSQWIRKQLGEIGTIQTGSTPKTSLKGNFGSFIPFIKPADFNSDGSLNYKNAGLSKTGLESARRIEANSVLMVCIGSIGKCGFTEREVTTNQQINSLTPAKGISGKFLFYQMLTEDFQSRMKANSAQATLPIINKSKWSALTITFPTSLREQQRIVNMLDEAFCDIAIAEVNTEKNLQNARALFQSHLESVFSNRGERWIEKRFSELCDIKHGYSFEGEFFSNKGDFVLLTPGNFYETGGYRDRGEKQKYFTGPIPRDYILRKGDMLVAMTEQAAGLLGSPIIVPESEKFLHNQRLGLIISKPGVPWLNEFFFHVFNTSQVRKDIHASASGVKVRHTSPRKIGEVVVVFPLAIAEQQQIVSKLESLTAETQRLAMLYKQKLLALSELKKSLLHQAFTGEL